MREQFLIPDLEYADDMCLLSNSMDELEEMLLDLDQSCNQMGLSISARKTKILSITSDQQESPRRVTLQSADEPVDVIDEFEYLGSVVTSSCELDREISTRIRKASNSFRSLCRTLWYQKSIKLCIKLRMFKAAIIPILLYGSESWTPLSQHIKRLQGFVMRCLRIILGISVRQKQRNTDIRAKASIETVDTMIRKRRLRWLGHVARMEPHRIPRRLLVCKFIGGKRAVGGQKLRWVDFVMRDLKKCKLDHEWMHVAQDRDKWSFVVETAVTELNEEAVEMEKMKKDKRKERRERKQLADQTDLLCNHLGCSFTAHNKAGLVKHQRQKHGAAAQQFLTCQHCQRNFRLQGFNNHVKFCHLNPNRTKRSHWGKLSPK